MADSELSKEERILRIMKKVLTNVAKDTHTPAHMKHPLSENTVDEIRHCLSLIVARETELAEEAGRPMTDRPRFVDEPQDKVVVSIDSLTKGSKKKD